MSTQKTAILLYFSGIISLLSGVLLLVTGNFIIEITNISLLIAAVVSGVIGFFMSKKIKPAFWAGLIFMSIMVFYFGWLTIVNSNSLVDMLLNGELQLEPYNALHGQLHLTLFSFLAFIMSIIVLMLQFIRADANGRELVS
ncbi:MAG: hypothetical protein ACI97N_002664 [Cognaticolwellia sp.]|jgi:hypothetical protein